MTLLKIWKKFTTFFYGVRLSLGARIRLKKKLFLYYLTKNEMIQAEVFSRYLRRQQHNTCSSSSRSNNSNMWFVIERKQSVKISSLICQPVPSSSFWVWTRRKFICAKKAQIFADVGFYFFGASLKSFVRIILTLIAGRQNFFFVTQQRKQLFFQHKKVFCCCCCVRVSFGNNYN